MTSMVTKESYDEALATALGERITVERPNRLSPGATLQRAPGVPETEPARREEALSWTARLGEGASLAAALLALHPSVSAAQEAGSGEAADGTVGSALAPDDPLFAHHTAEVDGVRLHYVTAGRGDPVLLLHGWPQTWYEWRRLIPVLAERYTVIAPDLRGMGDSDKPPAGYDKRTVAEDIHGLMSRLNLGPAFVVGHDVGFGVAYAYAAAHPDAVRRLAMIEGLLPGIDPYDRIRDLVWHLDFHAVPDLPEAIVAGHERVYLSWFYRNFAYDPTAIGEDDIDEYVRAYSSDGGLRGGFNHYRAFAQEVEHNQESAATPLPMPVLAIGGEQSMGPLVGETSQAVASDVRAEVVPECGHWVPEEQPEYLAERLLEFFDEEG